MSQNDSPKTLVRFMLEQFDALNSQLQSNLNDYTLQIKWKAMQWIDNPTDTLLTYRETVAMVKTAHTTLLEHLEKITESMLQYPKMDVEKSSTPDSHNVKQPEKETFYGSFVLATTETVQRLESIESSLSSLQETKQKTEHEISKIQQWQKNFLSMQSDIELKIEHISKKQKQRIKKLVNQMNVNMEQNKEMDNLRAEELNKKESLEKLNQCMTAFDYQLNTMKDEMKVYKSKSDTVTQDVKKLWDLILALKKIKIQMLSIIQ